MAVLLNGPAVGLAAPQKVESTDTTTTLGVLVDGVANVRRVTYAPTGTPNQAIRFTDYVEYIYNSSASNSGAGHHGGAVFRYRHQGSGNPSFCIGMEAKVDNETAATITTAKGFEVQLASNAGTITNYLGVVSQIVTNAGTVGTAIAYDADIAANAGTITTFIGFLNHNAAGKATTRYCLWNQDPGAPILSVAPIVDASTSFSTGHTNGGTISAWTGLQTTHAAFPSATLSSQTVNLPTSPIDGHIYSFVSSQTITAVTWAAAGGAAVLNGPTTLAASKGVRWLYLAVFPAWLAIA